MQTVRRRTGLAYILAGLAFVLGWLVLSARLAQPVGFAIIAAGIFTPTVIMHGYAKRRIASSDG
jgi:hypothetical protein